MGRIVTPLEMKQFIIETLGLEDLRAEDIGDEEPLFAGGIGLDSIDGLELDMALRQRFQLPAPTETAAEGHKYLMSVSAMVAYVAEVAEV